MTSFFKGVFFKIYQWFKRLNIDNIPEYTSVCFLSVLVTFNIITVVMYIRHLFGAPFMYIPKIPSVLIGLVFMVLMYFGFIHNGKHVEIYKEYSKSVWSKRTGSFIVVTYILLSIILLISLIWLNPK